MKKCYYLDMSWDIIKMQICKFLFPSNLPRYVHEKNLGVVATMMVDFKFKTVIAIINKVCTADLQISGPWTSFIQTGCAVKGDY